MARLSASKPSPLRGQVWFTELRDIGEKPLLVVSNNDRNRALPTVLTVRVTSAPKLDLSTIVSLAHHEPVRGRIVCDDVYVVPKARLHRLAGELSSQTMRLVDEALHSVFGMEH